MPNIRTLAEYVEFDGHEFLMSLQDKVTGLNAYIGIHNTNLGPALGGTRYKAYYSQDEALRDVLNLSRAMSYKCALAKLPYGGAKGVIIIDPAADKQNVLTEYSRRVDKLSGLFKTGTDVGISDDDVALMSKQTPHMLGVVPADRSDLNTSKVAALGVFHAAKAVLKKLYGSDDFNNRSIAIKGAGKLGGELARLVSSVGGKVYISDINQKQCQELKQQLLEINVVENDEIHKQTVDIYAPCALGNEFTPQTIPELKCKAIAGGANNQLADIDSGKSLHDKGILYAPDYVANAGGLIYVADELEADGFNKDRVLKRTGEIEDTLLEIFDQAEVKHMPTYLVADEIAVARINGKTV